MAEYTVDAAAVAFSEQALFYVGVANEALDIGEFVRFNASRKVADGRNRNKNNAGLYGGHGVVASSSASGDEPIRVCYFDPAFKPGFTMEVGTAVVLGNNWGALAPETDLGNGNIAVMVIWPITTEIGFLSPVLAIEPHS